MKRRQFMNRAAQIAAALGLGTSWATAAGRWRPEALPAQLPVFTPPVLEGPPAFDPLAPGFRTSPPDLLDRGIRQVFFNDHDARILPWLLQQDYLKRQD